MRRSIRKFNIQPPGHLNFSRLACSNSLLSGQKSRSNAPPISTELPLLKANFIFNQTLYNLSERDTAVMTPSNFFLKTLSKELFTKKGESLSCKSIKPCKNRKNSLEQEINPVQIPHPSNTTFKFPPPRARCTVKCPGGGGGVLKFRIDRRIRIYKSLCFPLWILTLLIV